MQNKTTQRAARTNDIEFIKLNIIRTCKIQLLLTVRTQEGAAAGKSDPLNLFFFTA